MKEFSNKLKVFFLSAIVLTIISSALFTVSMLTAFDADAGYFSSSSLLPYIQKAVVIVSVLFFASIAVFIPKKILPSQPPSSPIFTMYSTLACGFLFVIGAIIFYNIHSNDAEWMQDTARTVFAVASATGYAATVYFLICGITAPKKYLPIKVITALFVIANLLFFIIFEHLDYFVTINSVRKTMVFISFALAIMFIAQDLRFKAGIGQPRAYFFFGATTMLLCATTSISHIIAYYAGVLKDSSFLVYYLVGLGLALYSFAHLLDYVKLVNYLSEHIDDYSETIDESTEV